MALRTGNLIMDLFKRSSKWKNIEGEDFEHFRNILLLIADDIVEICKKNNLKYCLAYGSALGAVRHRGFIPWDDDVDFFMPREDYEKFMEIMQKEKSDKYYVSSVSKGDKIAAPTCHVRLKNTYYINYGDLILTANEPDNMRGIYLDIAPLDNAPNNDVVRYCQGICCLFLLFAANCVIQLKTIKYLQNDGVVFSKEEKKQLRLKKILGRFFSMVPEYQWVTLYDKVTSMSHNNQSKYVTCYSGYKKISKSVYKRADIVPFTIGLFEGRAWHIPNDCDSYLKQMYGDYMKIPKGEHKKIHPVLEIDFGNY